MCSYTTGLRTGIMIHSATTYVPILLVGIYHSFSSRFSIFVLSLSDLSTCLTSRRSSLLHLLYVDLSYLSHYINLLVASCNISSTCLIIWGFFHLLDFIYSLLLIWLCIDHFYLPVQPYTSPPSLIRQELDHLSSHILFWFTCLIVYSTFHLSS